MYEGSLRKRLETKGNIAKKKFKIVGFPLGVE